MDDGQVMDSSCFPCVVSSKLHKCPLGSSMVWLWSGLMHEFMLWFYVRSGKRKAQGN